MSESRSQSVIAALRHTLDANPGDAASAHNLSVLLGQRGALDEAVAFAIQATSADPSLADAWLNLGNLNAITKRFQDAITAFEHVTELTPRDPRGWQNLGNCLAQVDRIEEAVGALERGRTLAPDNPHILGSLALAYRRLWRYDDALAAYKSALAADPSNAKLHSNVINALHYQPGLGPDAVLEAHTAWAAAHAPRDREDTMAAQPKNGPLRVGYVSGDFRRHPIGFFLLGVLRSHDRSVVTPVCISDTATRDEMTAHLQKESGEWIGTQDLNEDEFVSAVRGAALDIVIDLAGHFKNNRLQEFARRLAPVQATWVGYVGTTGVPAMDWLIADSIHAPNGFDAFTTERIVRLPDDYVCYTPPDDAPAPGPLPFDRNSFMTFGCFNNPNKLNAQVINAWAQIMSALPNSRLILKYKGFDQPAVVAAITRMFAQNGIEADRLDLRGRSSHSDLLTSYNEIDIALDPWPYSGGLTTLEALWMGVPVLTQTGETFAGRHSTSHLTNVGLSDWCRPDTATYMDAALNKAADIDTLRTLRGSLRDRMKTSPLLNQTQFTRALERAYSMMWETACSPDAKDGPRTVDIPSVP